MSNKQAVGVVLLVLSLAIPGMIYVGYEIYWLIKNLHEGGVWEEDAAELLAIAWSVMLIIAMVLIIL